MVEVTDEFLAENAFGVDEDGKGISINSAQANILGLEWNDVCVGKWKKKIIGLKLSEKDAKLFSLLYGIRGKSNQNKIIDSFRNKTQ
jgi:hypothetical protein